MDHRDGYIIAAKQYMDQVNKFIATIISLFNQIYHLSKKNELRKFLIFCMMHLEIEFNGRGNSKKSDHKPK